MNNGDLSDCEGRYWEVESVLALKLIQLVGVEVLCDSCLLMTSKNE